MSTWAWVVVGLVAWIVLSVPLGVLTARLLRAAAHPVLTSGRHHRPRRAA